MNNELAEIRKLELIERKVKKTNNRLNLFLLLMMVPFIDALEVYEEAADTKRQLSELKESLE